MSAHMRPRRIYAPMGRFGVVGNAGIPLTGVTPPERRVHAREPRRSGDPVWDQREKLPDSTQAIMTSSRDQVLNGAVSQES